MNRIYWDKDKISVLTNQLDAAEHSHWMMQLFLSLEDEMEIFVSGKRLSCKCILVNKNVLHSFRTGEKLHFTMMIEPASGFAEQLNERIGKTDCYIFELPDDNKLQQLAFSMSEHREAAYYNEFMEKFLIFLGIQSLPQCYDERIKEFLRLLEKCTCDSHEISFFAEQAALSESRFSHLFREQTGVPLKSYLLLHQMERAFAGLFHGKRITEAAVDAGFDSPSHFAAAAKKMMGMPASVSLKNSEFLKVYSI